MTSIEHLRAFAKPLGVRILLENIPNELSTPEKLMEMIHTAHFDDVGICFDFGHAHMMGSVREAFDDCAEAEFARRTFTTMPKSRIRTCGRERERSTGRKRWNCCAPRRKRRRCCWNWQGDEKVNPLEKLGATFEKLETA